MDGMSGRGKLGDRGLVVDFYGLGERAKYRTERIGADGVDSRADVADWRIGGRGKWRTPSYWTGRIGRTPSYWTGRIGRTGADGADWGKLGRMRRTGRRGAYGADWTEGGIWVELGGT